MAGRRQLAFEGGQSAYGIGTSDGPRVFGRFWLQLRS